MTISSLGKTGINIPPIIFGSSALGNLYVELEENTKLSIISECIKNVQNPVVFDCAGKYGAGLALEMLGKCLSRLKINQNDIIISNKLGWYRTELKTAEPTFEQGVWKNLKHDAEQRISYQGIIECYEQGNQLLGGKYKPQLVSVHDPDEYLVQATSPREREKRFKDILEAYRALEELKAQGKVKAIGIGAKDWKVIEELEKFEKFVSFDWVMFANSYTIYQHPSDLVFFMQKLASNGVAIINSAVFHSGFLIGSNYFDYKYLNPLLEENNHYFKWRDKFFEVCKKFDIKPDLACVNFAKQAPGVVSIALNTSNPQRVKTNVLSVTTEVPKDFYKAMADEGLINRGS